ncbi:TetR family transcriptional regulator [Amycolatopsis antarctica]|uniref:TetR family transcriptional regulator n=1 Tax=Amycolatopsis antarctica TaxID=1854586 RepID=A0A263CYI1_9PSEU|nr:TetR/AcrR family transcriptional regulator [Amycolatopsis antarctica]OZM71220.1 TetR family transcriptional regulator [Amycolatopsis antarctica]
MSSSAGPARRYGGKTADERRQERRGVLVGSAVEIWQEQGWAAVTMRGVCARARLTDRYFYESFANRDELLATVWDQIRDQTLQMLLGVIGARAEHSALDQLHAALHALVHQLQAEPRWAQILFGDHSGSAVLEQRRRQTVQQATDIMVDLARPFLRDGVDDRALRTNVLLGIGGFVEIMLAWRSGLVDLDADTLVDQLTEVSQSLSHNFLRPDSREDHPAPPTA